MTVPAILAAAELLFAVILIIRLVTFYRRSAVHLLFAGMLACIAVWLFAAAMAYIADEYLTAVRWYRIACLGVFFLHAFTLHFVLVFTKRQPRRLLIRVAIYLPSVIFYAIGLTRLVVFEDFVWIDGVWMGIPAYSDAIFYLIIAHYTVYYLVVFFLLGRMIKRASQRRKKRQAVIIFASILISEVLFNVDLFLLPRFLNRFAFLTAPLYSIIWIVGIWIALRYYRLLGVYLGNLYEEILTQITDRVLFIDTDFHVLFANESAAVKLAALPSSRAASLRALDGFVQDNPVVREKIAAFMSSDLRTDTVCAYAATPSGKHLYRCRLTRIDDRFGDYSGVLIIIQALTSGKALQKEYSLTDRELEVLAMVIDGGSNRQMAEALGITVRTIKAHMTGIFAKTATKNRVTLVRLVYDDE